MRSLRRRKQDIWIVECEINDETIEGNAVYGKPRKIRAAVSNTSGTPAELPVGIVAEYTRYFISFDRSFKPQEGLLLFVDRVPMLDEEGYLSINEETNKPFTEPDYVLSHIMDTAKGCIARYGIKKVAGNG